jgi:pimeloyl-ACP methyl ester carboxylesterase
LDLDWDQPAKARFIERFSSFCRLMRFDKRGTGLSDRPTDAATLEERTDDIRAVMDACGSDRAVIFGASEGASMACMFAATYPQRTRGLIVWGGQARWVQTDDYPWGLTASEYERLIGLVREQWPSVEYLVGSGAGVGRDVDPAVLDWFLHYAQAGASPTAIVALERMNAQIDTRDILSTIQVPTLVMNRTEDPVAHIEAARDLAARIPGARFMEFPGATHSMYRIEPERVLAAIEEFVTGARVPIAADRFLATILFIDIVASTARAAALGDAAWRYLLEHFNALTRH